MDKHFQADRHNTQIKAVQKEMPKITIENGVPNIPIANGMRILTCN
jgi:hypothetical protein